ncbi:MAG: N-6 DNA methylase [Veillonella sp.]|uniref:N-6 DNA methylase n=1 Tax=Veillonella sp. TaxID=1926307 RepID=UPI0025F5F13D|nr:type I restriction-modification system subunit M/S [Veillonella sp.]MBS4913469.1 N-6 DNA methylase [Veillonella sp.]
MVNVKNVVVLKGELSKEESIMLRYSVNMLKELNVDTIEKHIDKITAIFQYTYYDSVVEVPWISFKDSILFSTLALVMINNRSNETDGEKYIANELKQPGIMRDFEALRPYYPQVVGHLKLCSPIELLTYIMFSEPLIRSKSEYNVGLSINRLLVELLRDEICVYDWGFAQGEFLVQALLRDEEKQVAGIEVEESNYIVTKIRLSLMQIDADLLCGDLFFERAANRQGYAAVICPPFKRDLRELRHYGQMIGGAFEDLYWYLDGSDMYRSEWPYILRTLESVRSGGKLIALTTNEAASSVVYNRIRLRLLEEGLVESIIQLPNHLLPAHSRSVILWVFSRKKNEYVRMIDAADIRTLEGRKSYLSKEDIREIVELYKYGSSSLSAGRNMSADAVANLDEQGADDMDDGTPTKKLVVDVPYDDLMNDVNSFYERNRLALGEADLIVPMDFVIRDEPGCDLSPVRYTKGYTKRASRFLEPMNPDLGLRGRQYIFLGEVCTIKRGFVLPKKDVAAAGDAGAIGIAGSGAGTTGNEGTGNEGKYITPKHLNNDIIDVLTVDSLEGSDTGHNKTPVTINSIIMSKSAPFKFGFVDDLKGKNVYSNGNTYRLTIDEEQINPVYLFMYLTSDMAKLQLDHMVELTNPYSRTKTVSIEDLKELYLPLLPRKEQDAVAAEFLKLVEKERQVQMQLDEILENKGALLIKSLNPPEEEAK